MELVIIVVFGVVIVALLWQVRQHIFDGSYDQQDNLLILNQINQQRDELRHLRQTIDEKLTQIQASNDQQLERIRQTVEEKLETTLQTRLSQSFTRVSEQLASVNRGLGEMQILSKDVSTLNKTLSGTKTRGILGEVQLANIIEDMLTNSQYDREVPTINGSSNRVEFAVKMPGEHGERVLLPVDSKFPLDAYQHLQDAYENGDTNQVEASRKVLFTRVKQFAHDINTKYVKVPETTNFGIMFLPTEGLYAEIVRDTALVDELRRKENVIVAGPSTMAAILNALAVGFRTVTIQENTEEISRTLGDVKVQFNKFAKLLLKAQKQLGTASSTIDTLVTTRTRAVERVLRDIEVYDDGKVDE